MYWSLAVRKPRISADRPSLARDAARSSDRGRPGLARTPHLLALVALAAIALLARWRTPSSREGTLLVLFVGTTLLHLQYAKTGWFYRPTCACSTCGAWPAEVAEAKLTGRYATPWIAERARAQGVRVAVLYERWLDAAGGVPPEWVRAGRRRVGRNVVLGDRTVAFYAPDPGEAGPLAEHLRAFAPELPPVSSSWGPTPAEPPV